jgi:hypothetical protein
MFGLGFATLNVRSVINLCDRTALPKNIGRWLIDLLDRASQIVAGSSAASGSL